jgi:predicted PurR-regulated permease PerM
MSATSGCGPVSWNVETPEIRSVRTHQGILVAAPPQLGLYTVRMFLTGKTLGQWFLLAIFVTVLYFCLRIMQPFLMAIFLALILSTLLAPVYGLLASKLKGRRSLAAVIVCVGLTAAILVPLVFLSISLANEANDAYQRLKDPETLRKIESWLDPGSSPIMRRVKSWLPSSLRLDDLQLGARLGTQAQQIGIAALGVATTFAAGVFNFLMDYFIMIVVLFFLLRDSAYFAESVRAISPLSDEQEKPFIDRFRIVTRATVLGNLVTALTQGAASALIFFSLALPNPVLWGALTALFSLIPVVGTALIWLPWAIYLFAAGSVVKAVIFLILQLVAVGGVDNILRPLLIEGGMRMHTLVVFFSILGGIGYFGILGMFFGPLLFAITITLLELYVSPVAPKTIPATMEAKELRQDLE